MPKDLTGIDWEAGGEHFKNTPLRMGYREYSENTREYSWTGYQSVSHDKIREKGKEGFWMRKRFEHAREANPHLFTDIEGLYGIVMNMIVMEADTISPMDLARLTGELIKLQDRMMEHDPTRAEENVVETLGRDEVLQILREETPTLLEPAGMLQDALDSMGKETPGESID